MGIIKIKDRKAAVFYQCEICYQLFDSKKKFAIHICGKLNLNDKK